MFGFQRKKVTGEWRKWHGDEFFSLYMKSDTKMIKSSRMRGTGHVASMRVLIYIHARTRTHTHYWLECPSCTGK
jgi:hypothetical protein